MFEKLINYFRESVAELKKVSWPTRAQAVRSTILVIVISFVTAVFLGGTDYFLNKILEKALLN